MTDPGSERVLVVPTARFHAAGLFHGFTAEVARYLPGLLDPAGLLYLPRGRAENDPSFKQLIPYVVLRCGGSVFHYTRGSKGSEARLHARRSIGIGGHVCSEDGVATADAYRAGLLRELEEEIDAPPAVAEGVVGLINDDTTPVGSVHLGIVHVFDLPAPRAALRDPALTSGGFAPLAELATASEQFETWSQFLLGGKGRAALERHQKLSDGPGGQGP
jgi:predicted NUDIX family phosphoesterase